MFNKYKLLCLTSLNAKVLKAGFFISDAVKLTTYLVPTTTINKNTLVDNYWQKRNKVHVS